MRVGFLGLGQMGGPMAAHVIRAGHTVALYDPVPAAVDARLEGAARAASSSADAARDAEVVCMVVRDDAQALAAIDATDGVLATAPPGAILLLHATVAPSTVRAVHEACTDREVRLVDAGISGGASGAEAATLYVMCGGDAATIDEARPVIDTYARHVVRFGDVGAGMAAKLARNLMHYCVWVSAHEGMAVAEAAGLDLRAFEHLVRESFVPDLIGAQLAKDTTAPFDPESDPTRAEWVRKTVELGWKDLDDAFALADEVGVETPMGRIARRAYGASLNLPLAPRD